MDIQKERILIYTDGACSGNPGPGGWACILIYGEHEKELSGHEPDTTNNRMELMAVIKGLEALNDSANKYNVEVYSDSSYIVNAINQNWVENWQKNGWRTADKKEVKNRDLWQDLINLNNLHTPKYIKVKGHSDDEYNNRCDALAVAQSKIAKI